MSSIIIFRLSRYGDIALKIVCKAWPLEVLQHRLSEYYGSAGGFNVAKIEDPNTDNDQKYVFRVKAPNDHWYVAMKLAPSEAEETLMKFSTITYTETK